MKIQLLIVSFITAIFPLFSKAQTNRVIFSGVYETNIFNSPSYKASFLYEHAINEKISLNYNFSLGVNGQDGFVFQGPMGAYGGSILLLEKANIPEGEG
ncbi:MAG TPA: hypothetical protein PLS12_08560, partial [Bacteroidales bacterium]|nr:hypothetical protein [Bacteroidales bacterium]